MTETKNTNFDWKSDPRMKDISPEKLLILEELFLEASNKKAEELMPFFMASISKTNNKGISFSNTETDLILDVLKKNMTPEEIKKIDVIKKFSKMMAKKKK